MPSRFFGRTCGCIAALLAPLAASADVQVYIGSSWQVSSYTNIDSSALGLYDYTLVQGPSYGGEFAIDPVSLADSRNSTSTGEAKFHDPLNPVGLPLVFTSASSASSDYQAVVGKLDLLLYVSANTLPDHVLVEPPVGPNPPDPVTIDNPLSANGTARIFIAYEDQIRFCAPGLALGAPIEVYARMLHPAVVASANTNFSTFNKASSTMTATLGGAEHWDGSFQYAIDGGGTFALTERSEKGVVIADDPDEIATTLALSNGDLLDVYQSVEGIAATVADAPFPATVSSVTVASVRLLLEPITAGVAVTRFGGGDPCTVPEPEPAGLGLGAIATLHACGALRRRLAARRGRVAELRAALAVQ